LSRIDEKSMVRERTVMIIVEDGMTSWEIIEILEEFRILSFGKINEKYNLKRDTSFVFFYKQKTLIDTY